MKKIIALLLTFTLAIGLLTSCFVLPNDDNNDDNEAINPIGTVNLSAEASHDIIQSMVAAGQIDIAILPEPKATVAINQAKAEGINYSVKLNLSAEWEKVSDTKLSMGCLIVRNDLIKNDEIALVDFLDEYKKSIQYIGNPDNNADAASMIVEAGILPKLPIAKSALTNLYGSIVYEDGTAMQGTLEGFYKAIDMKIPENSFCYMPNYSASTTSDNVIKVGVMNGPTGMGMAKLINDNKENAKYEFISYSDPVIAMTDLTSGEIDMACLPTNVGANLANKNAPVSIAAINCLGSLYVIAKEGVEINSVEDLIGKTVYYGVPTSTTEPIFRYILKNNNISVALTEGEKSSDEN